MPNIFGINHLCLIVYCLLSISRKVPNSSKRRSGGGGGGGGFRLPPITTKTKTQRAEKQRERKSSLHSQNNFDDVSLYF